MAENPAFHVDPHGKDFDLMILHAAWEQRATMDELDETAYAGGFVPMATKPTEQRDADSPVLWRISTMASTCLPESAE